MSFLLWFKSDNGFQLIDVTSLLKIKGLVGEQKFNSETVDLSDSQKALQAHGEEFKFLTWGLKPFPAPPYVSGSLVNG